MPAPHPRLAVRRGLVTALVATVAACATVVPIPAARAATGPVAYVCASTEGPTALTASADTDAPVTPAVMFTGDSVGATLTSALPRDLAEAFIDRHAAESFSGTVRIEVTEGPVSRALDLAIASTPLGDQAEAAAVPFTASGSYLATTPGTHAPTAAALAVSLDLRRADGTVHRVELSCGQAGGPTPVIDTVTVVARSATTLNTDSSAVRYGEVVTARAAVVTAGGAPSGDVAFTLDGVATKARLAADGTASWTLPTAPAGNHTLTASFVPADATHYRGSTSAAAALVVRKATTRTRVSVAGRRTARPTRVTARVRTPHGTTATGRVRLVLRKRGTGPRRIRSRTLTDGQRTLGLGRLARGRYTLVVRYSGDRNHMRGSRTVRRFRVRHG